MSSRHEVGSRSTLRAALHLLALIAMLAALGLASQTAEAKSKSSKSKSSSTSTSTSSSHSSSKKVDINTASLKELEDLPGIGTVMGQNIIAGRPYKSVADLKHAGIPQNTINGLHGKVMCSRPKTASKSASAYGTPMAEKSEAPREEKHETPKAEKSEGKTFFGIPMGGSSKSDAEKSRGDESRAAAEESPAQRPPAKGMVWVNTDTKIYHYDNDHWYGRTKHGKWLWEDQAIREGYRASKQIKH